MSGDGEFLAARCLLEIAQPSHALDAFQEVHDSQAYDRDHPRLAALRGLAAAYRTVGRHDRAQAFLMRCLEVGRTAKPLMARVAIAAAGDALVSEAPFLDHAQLRTEWLRGFPEFATTDEIRGRLRTLIY